MSKETDPKTTPKETETPNPAPPLESTFTDDPQSNPSAYPSDPETPGANPAHTSEGLAKMKGKEPYAPLKEEEPPKKGTIPGASKEEEVPKKK
jgi:hypothetical protein